MDQKLLIASASDPALIKETLGGMNTVDIADELERMDEQSALRVFRMLPKDEAAEVFAYLSRDTQQSIVAAITDSEIGGITNDLFLDDAVDFIEEMPASVVNRVLANVSVSKRNLINQFLKYPEDSVGSIMTVEYVSLKEHFTVEDAFRHIRSTGPNKETIYTCYVTDRQRRLLGAVSARELMLSKPETPIRDIMDANVLYAATSEDQESLANDFRKYGLLAMPVVDNDKRLVGIVTVDDIIAVQEEEATEDFELMAAMSPSEDPYLKTSVWKLTQNRVVWLMLLMLSATVTGAIISGFESSLSVLPALVAFIPMLMDTGGNAGSQSSTLVIRGMALEEVALGDVWAVLWKELRVALICGAALVAVNFARVVITGQGWVLALTVSAALYITVVMAKTVGCLLPMGAKKLGLDPAVMASPVITTIVDAGALLVYFVLAKAVLGI
ncbi:MAG: magnesium transporter [Clostridiales bacterium]|jgi:magnesium transporter|nr:magnesium transporter [Clostridiales bacterium]